MSEAERLALAQARADEAAARVRREVLERELRAAAPTPAPSVKRKARREPVRDTGRPMTDTDEAKARTLARDLGIPMIAGAKP